MNLTISTAPRKPKPKVGDTKLIKGVMHRRELKYIHEGSRRYLDCTGGKQRFVWVPVAASGVMV